MVFEVPFTLIRFFVFEAESSRSVLLTGDNPGRAKLKSHPDRRGWACGSGRSHGPRGHP